MNQAQ